MMAGGIIIMAAMMGVMFLFGGHAKGHKHNEYTSQGIAVSSSAITAAPAAQTPVPEESEKETEHTH